MKYYLCFPSEKDVDVKEKLTRSKALEWLGCCYDNAEEVLNAYETQPREGNNDIRLRAGHIEVVHDGEA